MSRYRKTTQRRRRRARPPWLVRARGVRGYVDLRKLAWWFDPLVQRLLRWGRR